MSSKIYTRTGDVGKTSLIGGKRVQKEDPRLEAYGTIDELSASLGILRSFPIDALSIENIIRIQKHLFIISAELAIDSPISPDNNPLIHEKETLFLESEIDRMEENFTKLKYFIIPGGHPVSAQCNMSRTICRRAERRICSIINDFSISKNIIVYINRLSDYLFILGRFFANSFKEQEIFWKPDFIEK